MQTMQVNSIEEKISRDGRQFWNVELGTPDGSTLLASVWEADVRAALGTLSRANVDIQRNAKGYAKITAVRPASVASPVMGAATGPGTPATGYRYLALDAICKLFEGRGIPALQAIEQADILAEWLERGTPTDEEGSWEQDN